jgi:hypothetical protein
LRVDTYFVTLQLRPPPATTFAASTLNWNLNKFRVYGLGFEFVITTTITIITVTIITVTIITVTIITATIITVTSITVTIITATIITVTSITVTSISTRITVDVTVIISL